MELKDLVGDAYREGMTVEDIAKAIKERSLVDPSTLPPTVSKETFDKTASELAALKKQAKERMSAEEAEKAQQQEVLDRMALLEKENNRMKQEKAFLSAGCDGETAAKLAGHVVEGNTDEFVKVQSAWLSEQKKAIYAQTKEELLKATPPVNTGAGENNTPNAADQLAKALGENRAKGMASPEAIPMKFA